MAEKGTFEHQDRTWDATTLRFSLPGRMDTYIIFETKTGLILSQAIKYPTQEVYMYLNSVDADVGNPGADLEIDVYNQQE